jgi:hypothetical protein
MDASISTIAGLFLLGGASVGTWCYMDLESKRGEERDCRRVLMNLEERFEEKTKALEAAKDQCQALKDLIDAKQSLQASLASLQKDRDALQAEFVETIKVVRNKSIGSAIPELLLPSGLTLENVTLQKVTESGITLAHSGGVTKLLPAEVPKHMRQRYRLGVFPMTSDVAVPVMAHASPSTPPPTAPVSGQPAVDSGKAGAHLQVQIADLETKIAMLTDNKLLWQTRATTYQSQATQAQTDGKPSYNYSTQAASAHKNVDAINAQIYQFQNQITALRQKLIDSGDRR